MKAYLVQHAKALSKEEDPERPLSDEGRREIEAMARYAIDNVDLEVARIWNSGKTRAAQTAELLAEHLKPPLGVRVSEELGPVDDPKAWADRLPEMSHDVMLVGHLPHLSKLTSLLLAGDPERTVVNFRNAGIVCLAYEEESWSLQWLLRPELIPS